MATVQEYEAPKLEVIGDLTDLTLQRVSAELDDEPTN